MQNKTLQQTPEWHEAKQSKISASEIFALVRHYCKKELEEMSFDLKEEKSFRTVQELFLKVKFDAKLSEIDPIHSEFGNGMEAYVAYRLGQELPQIKIERSKEFIINEALHSLAACSPDGYIELVSNTDELLDFDNTCKITTEWGKGAIELKTANYFANFGSDKGSRLHYIFQLQYQMMVMDLKWGCLAVLMPKEKQFDEPFFKGKILEKVNYLFAVRELYLGESIDQYYDLKYYIYPELPRFRALILKALLNFQNDLDGYSQGRQECFPRNSEDLAGLQREKALWAQLWPEKYGELDLSDDFLSIDNVELRNRFKKSSLELDELFNDRYQARVENLFAEQNLKRIDNEILQKVKENGFDKYCKILGKENRMIFTKDGQVRFYKNKD